MNFRTLAALCFIPVGLAACGTSTSSSSSSAASPTPAAASPAASPTAAAPAGTAAVATGMATASGKAETVLTDTSGMTLYYRTSDTATSVCSGSCASAWPPVVLATGTPSSSASLPGTLALASNANGQQVTYQGHPLYRFASDNAPGQAQGDGKFGIWFAATPGLASA